MYVLQLAERFVQRIVSFDASIGALSYLLVPVGAYLAFNQQKKSQDIGTGMGAFVRYCFALHPSLKLSMSSIKTDIGFVIIKKLATSLIVVPLLFSSLITANMSFVALEDRFGVYQKHAPSLFLIAAMIGACVIVQDFVEFMAHYIHHKVKLLWAIHKVHHSAEFLMISLSVKRTHFLEEIIGFSANSAIVGIVIGVMSYIFSVPIRESEIYGVDAWFFLQLFSFWHLRHSHMSLSYGWLENIFQSPAQHQLHHSFEKAHWDKNFGLLFSFWDRAFGCFLRSVEPGSFRIGLPEADRHEYDSVLKLYVTPFRKIWEATANSARHARGSTSALVPTVIATPSPLSSGGND